MDVSYILLYLYEERALESLTDHVAEHKNNTHKVYERYSGRGSLYWWQRVKGFYMVIDTQNRLSTSTM